MQGGIRPLLKGYGFRRFFWPQSEQCSGPFLISKDARSTKPRFLYLVRRKSRKILLPIEAHPPHVFDVLKMAAPNLQSNDREAALIQRVCRGEYEAFYELLRPYERAIYFAAMGVLSNPADAEEVSQETVLTAFRALPNFRFEAKFSTWIIQIAINESHMKVRKDRRHLYEAIKPEREDEEGDHRPEDFADWREIPSEELQRKELREALRWAMAALAPKYREVLITSRGSFKFPLRTYSIGRLSPVLCPPGNSAG